MSIDFGQGDRCPSSRAETTGRRVQRNRLVEMPPGLLCMDLLPRHLSGASVQRGQVSGVSELKRTFVVVLGGRGGSERCCMVACSHQRITCTLAESPCVEGINVSLERLEEVRGDDFGNSFLLAPRALQVCGRAQVAHLAIASGQCPVRDAPHQVLHKDILAALG